jgi:hypothetical protein
MIDFNVYEDDRFIFEDILIIPTFLSLVGDSLLKEPDFKALITVPTKSARVFQRYIEGHLPYGDVPNIIILDLQTKMMHPYMLYSNRDYQVFSGQGVYLGGLPCIFDAITLTSEAGKEYQQGTLSLEDARSECFEVRDWNACYQWLSFMTTNSSRRKGGKGMNTLSIER